MLFFVISSLVIIFSLSTYAAEEEQYDFYAPGIPSYQPAYWNNDNYVLENNNCYNYSCNKRTDTYAIIGKGGGYNLQYPYTVEKLTMAALRDGLEKGTKTGILPIGKARVALYLASYDYHWYRQDSDGYWSHKIARQLAQDRDYSGKFISDIEKADRQNYKTLVGYFYVDSDTVEGKGHENIK